MMLTETKRPAGPADTGGRSVVRRIFTRYTVGSVVAAGVSEATLLLGYGIAAVGPRMASIGAWSAGAIVNYVLNRWWAWSKRGRAPLRELAQYWTIAVVSLVTAAWATGVADRLGPRFFDAEWQQVAFVGVAFLGAYGLLFFAKFFLFHYVVFVGADDRPRRRRSRHQVPSTTLE